MKQFNIGGTLIPAALHEVTKRERIADPDKPGKNKFREYKDPILVPQFNSVLSAITLFGAMLNAAEAREAGAGGKLAESYLVERFDEAFEESAHKDTGEVDVDKYIQLITSAERPRSSGQSLDTINAEIGELAPELIALTQAANVENGWQTILNVDGTATYADEDAFALRLAEVITRVKNLNTVREAKQKTNAERKLKKEENRAKAAADAAKAAAVAVKA